MQKCKKHTTILQKFHHGSASNKRFRFFSEFENMLVIKKLMRFRLDEFSALQHFTTLCEMRFSFDVEYLMSTPVIAKAKTKSLF